LRRSSFMVHLFTSRPMPDPCAGVRLFGHWLRY
jgi:hypothetical protein